MFGVNANAEPFREPRPLLKSAMQWAAVGDEVFAGHGYNRDSRLRGEASTPLGGRLLC